MLPQTTPVDRRAAIVRAAREVFVESGLAGARTREIARRAGVAEGLLFKHFKTKDALFELAVVDSLEVLVARLDEAAVAFVASEKIPDQAERAVDFHRELLTTMVEIAPLLGAVLFAQREIGEDFYRRRLAPTIASISDALRTSLRRKRQPTVDLRTVALLIFGSHFFFALDADYRAVTLDVEDLARSMTVLLGDGLHLDPWPGTPDDGGSET